MFFIPKSVKIQKVTGAKAFEPSSRDAQDLSKRRIQTDLRETAEDLGKGTETKRGDFFPQDTRNADRVG